MTPQVPTNAHLQNLYGEYLGISEELPGDPMTYHPPGKAKHLPPLDAKVKEKLEKEKELVERIQQ